MFVSFLDQIDHEIIEKEQVIQLFAKIQATDLEYSNSGYLALDMPKQGQIILLFWWIDTTHLILRYDKNIPTVQQGESWLSCNEDLNLTLFDVGDDTWLPLNSIISLHDAINVISELYDQPLNLSNQIRWQNVADVMWKD